MTDVARQDNFIPTQVISAGGYSLSLMLLVLAAALYLGWLPSNVNQADLAASKPAVPVVKSPDTPAKVQIAPQVEPDAGRDTAEPPQIASNEETEAPQQPTQPVDEPEVAPVPDPEPTETTRLEEKVPEDNKPLVPETDPTSAQPLPSEQAQDGEPNTPDDSVAQKSSEDTLPPPQDTLTEQDLKIGSSTPQPAGKPIVADPTKPEGTDGQTQRVGESSLPATKEVSEPEIRVVSPKPLAGASNQSPKVVIRIPQDPTQDLKVLPAPKVVPQATPAVPKQSPTVVVRIPETEELPRDQSLSPVVPRAKPSSGGKPVELVRVDPVAPRPKTSSKSTAGATQTGLVTVDTSTSVAADQRAPKPMVKPEWLLQPPSHTSALPPKAASKVRVHKPLRRKPSAAKKVKRSNLRTQRAQRASDAKRKPRRTNVASPRIHRPPVHKTGSGQAVSLNQETYCLAMAIYYEAGRKTLRSQVAVSREILERVESFNFPNSVCEVVYQYAHRRGRCRYSFACDGRPDRPRNKPVWRHARALAKAQISCGPRCGCSLQRTTLVSNVSGRSRKVIRCQAGFKTPAQTPSNTVLGKSKPALRVQIKPVSSASARGPVSVLGRDGL